MSFPRPINTPMQRQIGMVGLIIIFGWTGHANLMDIGIMIHVLSWQKNANQGVSLKK